MIPEDSIELGSINTFIRVGYLCIGGLSLLFLAWSLIVPLNDSSVTQGSVTVGSGRQTIAHVDGGKIDEIYVEIGDQVQQGDQLIQLNDEALQTELKILQYQLYENYAMIDRLTSEQELAQKVSFRDVLVNASQSDSIVYELIEGERRNFKSRRDSHEIDASLIEGEIEHSTRRKDRLQLQVYSVSRQINITDNKINDIKKLIKRGFGKQATLNDLENERERYIKERLSIEGQIDESLVSIDNAKKKKESLHANMIAENEDRRTSAIRKAKEIEDRMDLVRSKIYDTSIFSNIDGVIVDMHVSSANDVVLPASPILEVVPQHSELIVEASVPPQDIEGIHEGAQVEIRFPAFAAQDVPSINGEVSLVSADVIAEENHAYYRVHAKVQDWKELGEGLSVMPGMPAEVIIQKRSRTLVSYLLGPIGSYFAKAVL